MVVYRLCRREAFSLPGRGLVDPQQENTSLGVRANNSNNTVVVALVGTIIDQNGYKLVAKLSGYSPLGAMPAITNPVWNWIDLTFGLFMVGIFEELIFRGYMHTFISRYTKSSFAIVVITAVAFGLIHWSFGLHDVLITSTIGAVFMTAYLRTRSLPALMLAHFAVNFIDFAGIIPKSIFTFI